MAGRMGCQRPEGVWCMFGMTPKNTRTVSTRTDDDKEDNIALTKLQLSNPHSCRVGDIILHPGMNLGNHLIRCCIADLVNF
jgi:hypothetical protein